jgi:hypothetical protein
MGEKMGEERCEGERETTQVSSSVGVVVNVQWSQIRDPWLGGGTPFRPLVKSLRFLMRIVLTAARRVNRVSRLEPKLSRA